MKVLGIETATAICAAAVVKNGITASEKMLNGPQVHSEHLISIIDEVLSEANIVLDDLDGIAVSIGPGSFTGLRIGLSVAKGLSYAVDKHLVAVPTLEALAWNGLHQKSVQKFNYILPVINARRSEVYGALYRNNGDELEEVSASKALTIDEVINQFHGLAGVLVVGDGTVKLNRYLQERYSHLSTGFIFPSGSQILCTAQAVAMLGEIKLCKGLHADLGSIEPLYNKDFHSIIRTQHSTEG